MSPSNMISVIVAICFVVSMGLGDTPLLYYAARRPECPERRERARALRVGAGGGVLTYAGQFDYAVQVVVTQPIRAGGSAGVASC